MMTEPSVEKARSDAELVRLQPADVLAARGRGWVSAAIALFTRSLGEPRTKATHVGVIVAGGTLEEAVVVEALSRVRRHRLVAQYGDTRTKVGIYRPLNLTPEEKRIIVARAEGYVNRRYGFLKLLAHLADWALQGVYLFRWFAVMDRYPICSWLVAHAFAAVGRDFGLPPGGASPDDIMDFIEEHPKIYSEVLPMGRLPGLRRRRNLLPL